MKQIVVEAPFDLDKPVDITVNGVKGESCKALTENIEKALGEVQAETLTEEYYEQPEKERDHLRER